MCDMYDMMCDMYDMNHIIPRQNNAGPSSSGIFSRTMQGSFNP